MPVGPSTSSGGGIGNVLQVESQVRRPRRVGREAAEGIETREQPAQADVRRSLAENAALKDVIAKKL